MDNKKETAVDFIFSQLPDEYTTTRQGFEVYTQAKQMEKEQHDKTSLDWFLEGKARMSNNKKWNSFEQYYEQTYGGKDGK